MSAAHAVASTDDEPCSTDEVRATFDGESSHVDVRRLRHDGTRDRLHGGAEGAHLPAGRGRGLGYAYVFVVIAVGSVLCVIAAVLAGALSTRPDEPRSALRAGIVALLIGAAAVVTLAIWAEAQGTGCIGPCGPALR